MEVEPDTESRRQVRRGAGRRDRVLGPPWGTSDRHRAAGCRLPDPGGDLRSVEVGVDRHGHLTDLDARQGGGLLHRLPGPESQWAAHRGVRADMTDTGVVEQAEGPAASRGQRLHRHPIDRSEEAFDRLVQRPAAVPAGDGGAEGPVEVGVGFGEGGDDQPAGQIGHPPILAPRPAGCLHRSTRYDRSKL